MALAMPLVGVTVGSAGGGQVVFNVLGGTVSQEAASDTYLVTGELLLRGNAIYDLGKMPTGTNGNDVGGIEARLGSDALLTFSAVNHLLVGTVDATGMPGATVGSRPQFGGVLSAALQPWEGSTGKITMMPPVNTADVYSEDAFGTASPRVFLENAPGSAITLDAFAVNIRDGGIRLPAGVPSTLGARGLNLMPGGAPMSLPNGAEAAMTANGDVLITLPTGGLSGIIGSGALASTGGLYAVTITPAGMTTGRDGNGLPMAVDGGIEGNQKLRGLLEQIADFLPQAYRKRWGLRARSAAASGTQNAHRL
jgi:hypothetical protein